MNFISETKLFVGAFLKNRKDVGSVISSSSFLARKMINDPSFANAGNIVELGPGLGCVTEEIVRRMHSEAVLTLVEINPDFCDELRKRFEEPRIRVLNISALEMSKFVREPVDYIISGIPIANLSDVKQSELFDAIRDALAPAGVYVQFQYSLLSLRLLRKHFHSVDIRFTLFNIPPAFVYVCHKS